MNQAGLARALVRLSPQEAQTLAALLCGWQRTLDTRLTPIVPEDGYLEDCLEQLAAAAFEVKLR